MTAESAKGFHPIPSTHSRTAEDSMRFVRHDQRFRLLVTWMVDAAAWTFGLAGAVFARYAFNLTVTESAGTAAAVLVAVCLHTVFGHLLFLYRGRYGFGTFEEVRAVSLTVLVTALVVLAVDVGLPRRPVPASAPVVGAAFTLVLMFGARYLRRLQHERALRPDARRATPALLFGAGDACQQLLGSMVRDPRGRYVPVGLIDDDPAKRHLRVRVGS
jgi:FlaA1/EpsC-like NDP-sugar epimerase